MQIFITVSLKRQAEQGRYDRSAGGIVERMKKEIFSLFRQYRFAYLIGNIKKTLDFVIELSDEYEDGKNKLLNIYSNRC